MCIRDSSSGKVKVDKTRITDKGIVAEGIVALKILYIIGNDEMCIRDRHWKS